MSETVIYIIIGIAIFVVFILIPRVREGRYTRMITDQAPDDAWGNDRGWQATDQFEESNDGYAGNEGFPGDDRYPTEGDRFHTEDDHLYGSESESEEPVIIFSTSRMRQARLITTEMQNAGVDVALKTGRNPDDGKTEILFAVPRHQVEAAREVIANIPE